MTRLEKRPKSLLDLAKEQYPFGYHPSPPTTVVAQKTDEELVAEAIRKGGKELTPEDLRPTGITPFAPRITGSPEGDAERQPAKPKQWLKDAREINQGPGVS